MSSGGAVATAGGLRYKDKVTIVTGGSRGIGEGCVRVFVRHGSKVVFCSKDDDGGEALMAELNCAGGPGEALYLRCDVTKEEDIKRLVSETVERFGQIDCLINNAGCHPPTLTIDDVMGQEFKELFEMNVLSYFLACKYALPHLRKTRGNIINNSSLVATIGQPGAVAYCATKGAVSAMTRALAIDEATHGVRVNAFSPGNIMTPMQLSLADQSGDREAALAEGRNAQLLGRFGAIEECGQLCLYLAAEGTFCTGLDIPLSGGAELNYGNKNRTLTTDNKP